jgi:hypothetical protein
LRVQARVRRRVIKAFVRWGLLEPDEGELILEWRHGGGFSVDASVYIEANDRAGLECPLWAQSGLRKSKTSPT